MELGGHRRKLRLEEAGVIIAVSYKVYAVYIGCKPGYTEIRVSVEVYDGCGIDREVAVVSVLVLKVIAIRSTC